MAAVVAISLFHNLTGVGRETATGGVRDPEGLEVQEREEIPDPAGLSPSQRFQEV